MNDPDILLWALVIGILCIYLELIRPGWVLPGVTGTVLILLAASALVRHPGPFSPVPAAIAAVILTLPTLFLVRIAIRARRNKRKLL